MSKFTEIPNYEEDNHQSFPMVPISPATPTKQKNEIHHQRPKLYQYHQPYRTRTFIPDTSAPACLPQIFIHSSPYTSQQSPRQDSPIAPAESLGSLGQEPQPQATDISPCQCHIGSTIRQQSPSRYTPSVSKIAPFSSRLLLYGKDEKYFSGNRSQRLLCKSIMRGIRSRSWWPKYIIHQDIRLSSMISNLDFFDYLFLLVFSELSFY